MFASAAKEHHVTYFADLSDYRYNRHGLGLAPPGLQKNVGWLEKEWPFETTEPDPTLLDLLWEYCEVSIAQMRGLHPCNFCGTDQVVASRNGKRLLLGSAEIRAIAPDQLVVYAAPNLILHYVETHRYRPPRSFVDALRDGTRPCTPRYRDILTGFDLEITSTLVRE